jgi:hypothetical protein
MTREEEEEKTEYDSAGTGITKPPTSEPVPSFDVSKPHAPPKDANETLKVMPNKETDSDTTKKLKSKSIESESSETAVDTMSMKPDSTITPPPQPTPKPSFDTTLNSKEMREDEKR